MIDLQTAKEHLRLAEEHVAAGERSIARQRQVIRELERDGHDSTNAHELLEQFEEIQAMHVQGRDRLVDELAGLTREP